MLDLAAKVNANEPGCHLYKLCKDADGGYTVMELYEDADAMAAHGASEHFKAAGAGFKGLDGRRARNHPHGCGGLNSRLAGFALVLRRG